jgi:hypothetical protein
MSEIEIVAHQCKQCGRIHYPRHERCLTCHGREFERLAPSGQAKLLTYTQIFNLPWGFDQRFLYIGVAEFENGVKAMGQIDAPDHADLRLGMALTAAWEPVRTVHGEPVFGLRFRPA